MATQINYNGIIMDDVLTEDISQEVIFDKTGVDPTYVKLTASFRTVVHTIGASTLGLSVDNPIAHGFDSIQAQLMQPRRDFTMTIAGFVLFDIKPAATRPGVPTGSLGGLSGFDLKYGPIPKVKLLQVISNHSYRIQFQITAHVALCDGSPSDQIQPIINFRFWIGEDISGDDWTTKRIYRGRLTVAHHGINVHEAIRQWVSMPPLQAGYRRESIQLQESPDGLEIDFTVTDKELWAHAPFPATKWRGYHREYMNSPAVPESELHIELWGDNRQTKKQDLINLASNMIIQKLHLFDGAEANTTFLTSISFTDHLPNMHISASAHIKHQGTDASFRNLIAVYGRELGVPFSAGVPPIGGKQYDKDISFLGRQSPDSMAGLFLSLLQDPCHPAEMPQDCENQITSVVDQKQCEDAIVKVGSGTLSPYTRSCYSEEHYNNMYTNYQVTSDVRADEGTGMFPFGESSDDVTEADTVKCLRLYKPAVKRYFALTATRLNAYPIIMSATPFTDGNGIRHDVLEWRPTPSAPQLSADGCKTLHRTDYDITYCLSRYPTPEDNLAVGQLPYFADGYQADFSEMNNQFVVAPDDLRSPIYSPGIAAITV